jgi:class 3 adenylate cyclase
MAQPEAPHTRGFLFADLRGYTRFVETHGDKAASELLSAYRTLVRSAVAHSSGAEIRTEGDGFYVVFPSASSAIRCAMAILEEAAQSAAAGGPLPVGIGIHAGETEDSAEGFVGSAVNIAARVCALAGPGELLVTETVRSLVRTSMPLDIEPRGRRHLKGIRESIPLFAVRPTGAAPRSRARRFRSRAALSLERRPVLAAFAALVGVASVATVVLGIGLLANATANPVTTNRPEATAIGSVSPSPMAVDTFPTAAERSLMARIDPAIARLCSRAPTSDYPRFTFGNAGPLTAPVLAGLRCALGGSQPDFVVLLAVEPRFRETTTVDRYFFARVGVVGARVGDCATDGLASMDWSFGRFTGKLLCVVSPARARLDWIFDGEAVIGWAERDDGDGAALYRWWLAEGRAILH